MGVEVQGSCVAGIWESWPLRVSGSSLGTVHLSWGSDGGMGLRTGVLLFSGDCVTSSFPGHLPGVSVVPVAFLIMSDKLLHFIQF